MAFKRSAVQFRLAPPIKQAIEEGLGRNVINLCYRGRTAGEFKALVTVSLSNIADQGTNTIGDLNFFLSTLANLGCKNDSQNAGHKSITAL